MSMLGKRSAAASENIIIQPSGTVKKQKVVKNSKLYARKFSRKSNATTKVVRVRQISNLGDLISYSTGDSLGIIKFNFDDIPNYADLATVFDQYKIDKVKLRMVPRANTINALSGGNSQARSILYTAFDPNDATAPASYNALIQYQNCTMTPYCEELTRTIYPRILVNSSDEEGQVSISAAGTWCATDQKDVAWYGLKFGVTPNGNSSGTEQRWNVMAEFYLSFKNIK